MQVPTAGEMVAQVRQGQATVFQVAYAWLLARLGEQSEIGVASLKRLELPDWRHAVLVCCQDILAELQT